MKCNHCDKTIPEGSSFCPYCGSRIGVPDSLKCPICNLDVPIGTSFCPNCGSPIGVSKSPVCGKCGTVLQEGDKFCPNCGSPIGITQSTDFNQSRNEQSGKQGVNHGFASKAEELYQQSKKYINEKVQPQFDERINEFKSVDWSEKKSESVSFLKGFFSNTDKLRKVTLWIAVISVLWFFIFNDGFSASWMWWALALMVIGAAFYKAKSLNEARKLFVANLFFALCFFVYSPSESGSFDFAGSQSYEVSNDSHSISFSSEQDVRTYLCSHRFSSRDGYTLSFSSNAYEVSLNGRVLTSTTDVYVTSSNSASIRTHGPYGNTTFKLSVSGGDGVIRDTNDGESYYSR